MSDIRVTVPNNYDYIISTSTDFPLAVSGIEKLVQVVTFAVKTTPGRDILDPVYGMGIRSILPSSAHPLTAQKHKSDVARALLKIEEEIISLQGQDGGSSSELLGSLRLIEVEFDVENSIWEVKIKVTSVAGENGIVSLTS